MATKRRSSKSNKSGGVTLYGVVLGLLLGLAAAVAVALFVTQVPMPFSDKASRSAPKVLLPDVRDAPDPNIGLHGRSAPAVPGTGLPGTTGPGAGAPGTTVPGTGVTPSGVPPTAGQTPGRPDAGTDDLGNLIARLGQETPRVDNQVSAPKQVATPSPPTAAPAPSVAGGKQGTYYLQAGAFRGADDAEAMRARVLMLGLSAHVEAANVNGSTIHRVRVGPFKGLDDMNQARSRLGGEKIETSVVRQ